MKQKPVRVGFDFDGVIAYNPVRVARAPIALLKRTVFGVKKLSFYYPKTQRQRAIWTLLHNSSMFPARGIDQLRDSVQAGKVEAHLITARYSFLDDHLHTWLRKHDLKELFHSIVINTQDEQPHLFKERMVRKLSLEYFIEDNLDIVLHLNESSKTKVYWIYNIIDRSHPYTHKYPYLGKALGAILEKHASPNKR